MHQFEGFLQKVTNRQSGVAAIETEDAIKAFLCDTECVSDWLLVSTAISRIQNRYVVLDGPIAVWDECRNRAEVFLDLGVSIIRYLEPIKVDLQEDAEDIVFAMRMKLNTIKAFHPMFRKHQNIEPHPFVALLELFTQDDPLQTKVAEAYPEIDNSVCEAVIEIRQSHVSPLIFHHLASSHFERNHSTSRHCLHSTNRLCLATITDNGRIKS